MFFFKLRIFSFAEVCSGALNSKNNKGCEQTEDRIRQNIQSNQNNPIEHSQQ
jgi:hypothetical protein